MGSPYVGEIRMFAGNFAPQGWATCDGQLLQIADYDTLFNLIGTTYGGDGQSTFALPNLSARLPVHIGNNGTSTYSLANNGGVTEVTLTNNQIPVHNHQVVASTDQASAPTPTNSLLAAPSTVKLYRTGTPTSTSMNSQSVAPVGGSQPHDNMQPYLAITFIISLFGIYPSPS